VQGCKGTGAEERQGHVGDELFQPATRRTRVSVSARIGMRHPAHLERGTMAAAGRSKGADPSSVSVSASSAMSAIAPRMDDGPRVSQFCHGGWCRRQFEACRGSCHRPPCALHSVGTRQEPYTPHAFETWAGKPPCAALELAHHCTTALLHHCTTAPLHHCTTAVSTHHCNLDFRHGDRRAREHVQQSHLHRRHALSGP